MLVQREMGDGYYDTISLYKFIIGISMVRPTSQKTPEELLAQAEKLREQRNRAAKKHDAKVIENGGMRFTLILEKQYAEEFQKLVERYGSRKKAFVFLLNEYLEKNLKMKNKDSDMSQESKT